MAAKSDLPQAAASCVEKLKVLADKTRLGILLALFEKPDNVSSLTERFAIEQSLLSHHLRVLRDAALVTTERRGKCVYYALAEGVAERMTSGDLRREIDLGCCTLSFDAAA